MKYIVVFAPRAQSQFSKIPRNFQQQLVPSISSLENNPRPHGTKKLSGEENLYRMRKGKYRIIYSIDTENATVIILKIARREKIYKK